MNCARSSRKYYIEKVLFCKKVTVKIDSDWYVRSKGMQMNSSEYQNAHEKNVPHGYFFHKGNAKLFFYLWKE